MISGKEGICIGERSIIGAGSLVNKNIPMDIVAIGIPMTIKEIANERSNLKVKINVK